MDEALLAETDEISPIVEAWSLDQWELQQSNSSGPTMPRARLTINAGAGGTAQDWAEMLHSECIWVRSENMAIKSSTLEECPRAKKKRESNPSPLELMAAMPMAISKG
jgi:hypothetical protein